MFESQAMALVNTVNLVGVMGKGVALQFKQNYPVNFRLYKKACEEKKIAIGKLLVVEESSLFGSKIIINFPTKTDWRKPSEYSYVDLGLEDLVKVISQYGITSIAIPPLGAGNGGLNWDKVKIMIESHLKDLPIDVYVYEPNAFVEDKMMNQKAHLTDGRALLLYMLFELVRQGEDVSEFSCEKMCYFLQRNGAEDIFKLQYTPQYYGPYSGKVRYVLKWLNGSYIMGYCDMNKKPFEVMSLVPATYAEIESYVQCDERLRSIADKTKSFLDGYYSNFALELLSSVDYLIHYQNLTTFDMVYDGLKKWNTRKKQLFSSESHVRQAYEHVTERFKG